MIYATVKMICIKIPAYFSYIFDLRVALPDKTAIYDRIMGIFEKTGRAYFI